MSEVIKNKLSITLSSCFLSMYGQCFVAFPFLLFCYDTEIVSFSESIAFIKVEFNLYDMRRLLFGNGFSDEVADNLTGGEGGV